MEFLKPTWGMGIFYLLITTHITIVSVTVFLHRYQTHRALTLHPAMAHFFRFWLWLTTGMVTREWVSVHRYHHANTEENEDPHSPIKYGIWRVLFGGAFLYRNAVKKSVALMSGGALTPDDWIERNLYSQHVFLGVMIYAIVDMLLFGVVGFFIWIVQMVWIPFFAAGVINGVGHYWGYKNFQKLANNSRNIFPVGILIGGEEFHNNHHKNPRSAKFSVKPWEFDIGWLYIRLLVFFKLAKVRCDSVL